MKKIVPFKKEIDFKTNVSEITSISLEHNYKIDENIIGEFIINGEYKMTDTSTTTEKFFFNVPFDIILDEKYLINKAVVDIDDFYYEIINDKTLIANIDVLIENLEEKPLIEKEVVEEPQEMEKEQLPLEERCIDIDDEVSIKDDINEQITNKEEFNIKEEIENPIINIEKIEKVSKQFDSVNIFSNLDCNETYSTYRVYIVRENDTIEQIVEKYNIPKEEIEKYNNIDELRIGDKLIIPTNE